MNTPAPPIATRPDPATAPPPPRRLVRVDACTDRLWDQVARRSGAGLFTAPPWLRAIEATYGFRSEARILMEAGSPAAGVVSIDLEDHRGRRRSSLPFCDRADPLASAPDLWEPLRADLLADSTPFTMRCLDDAVPATATGLRRVHEAAWHATTTIGPADQIFARLHPTARRNVRAARRQGVQVHADGGLGAVHDYFDLHRTLRKHKYRLLAQPREFFEQVWTQFAADQSIVTMLARLGDETIAGALFLVWDEVLYYKFGASRHEHLPARPNDAIFWAAMRWAIERGLRRVDWGLSELDQPGLVGFKRKWADVEGRIVTLSSAPGRSAGPPPMSDTLTALTALLTRDDVPDQVTEEAGALLYRYFC